MEENKFNFEESTDKNEKSASELTEEAQGFLANVWSFVQGVFNFRKDNDTE